MSNRLAQLEQAIATQRSADTDAARRTQQLMFYLIGTIGLAGFAVLLLAGYFQWRALSQLAQITSHHSAMLGVAEGVHQLAAPGRASVDVSNARLLDIVGQLEKKIADLERGGRLLAEPVRTVDPLADGQRHLEANEAQAALECFDRFLAGHPRHAEALARKAAALEKLGRIDEALAFCDQAIAANGSLVVAFLQKGGLLNRLNRYDEALKCYEQALLAQEKKAPKVS